MSLTSKILWLLPPEWRRAAETLRALNASRPGPVLRAIALNVAKVLTEAFGIAMVFPVLQFIERKGAVAELAREYKFWDVIVKVFGWVDAPINLATLSISVFLLIGLRQVASYYAVMETTALKESVSRKLSARMFNRVMTSRAEYLHKLGTGVFVSDVSAHCNSASSVLLNLVSLSSVLLTFGIYGGALLVAAPIPTLVTAVFGALVMLISWPQTVIAKRVSRTIVQIQQQFTQYLAERYRGWRLVKLSQSQEVEDRYVQRWGQRITDLQMESSKAAAKIQLYATPLGVLFALGGLVVAVEWLNLSLPDLTLFVVVVLRLMPMLEAYLRSRQALAIQSASLYRVKEVSDATAAARESDTGRLIFPGLKNAITFKGVEFVYPDQGRPALCGADAIIPAGLLTAITGPSGAGKSTLVDLIPRIMDPQQGTVLLDGTDVRDLTLASLRGHIAFVAQQPLLFDGSIAENVRYARPGATQDEVIEACSLAHAHEFIMQMPKGYETELGEAGNRISGGQRQRLALARAFLARASILILDEPTSALDYESERHIREALKDIRERTGLTVIIIAHRLSTIRDADQIIVMQDGRVSVCGAPSELHLTSDWYAAMVAEERILTESTGAKVMQTSS